MLRNLNYVKNWTLQLRWLSLGKFCYVNIHNLDVNKIVNNGYIVRISLSEKPKDSNLKESIDFGVWTE